jgi:hypothetical protein
LHKLGRVFEIGHGSCTTGRCGVSVALDVVFKLHVGHGQTGSAKSNLLTGCEAAVRQSGSGLSSVAHRVFPPKEVSRSSEVVVALRGR